MPAQSGPAERDDRRRAQGRAQPQARLRRGREPAGLAERSGELRLRRRHRAEEILRAELPKARPGYGFLGEEGGPHEGTDKTHTWIVDPLDGTTNFLHGIPHFAISIALEREGTIVAGLIYNPANDEFFTAERGKGAFFNDRRIRVAARKRLAERGGVLRAAASRARRPRAVPPGDAVVQDKVGGLRRFGAAALDLAYVAAGRFDAYWERGLSPWDFAAGVVLVREAGGFVTDLEDKERTIEAGDSSPATNGCIGRWWTC